MINVAINLKFSAGRLYEFVIGGSNSGHRRLGVTAAGLVPAEV